MVYIILYLYHTQTGHMRCSPIDRIWLDGPPMSIYGLTVRGSTPHRLSFTGHLRLITTVDNRVLKWVAHTYQQAPGMIPPASLWYNPI